jgi:hypothetical protein
MFKAKHAALLVLIVLGFVSYWYFWAHYRTSTGQAPLTYLTANNLSQFKEAFNGKTDRPRLVLLVSPT